MARINAHQLTHTAIRIEGGLIPADELSRLTTELHTLRQRLNAATA